MNHQNNVLGCLPSIERLAARFRRSRYPFAEEEELVQEGFLGVLESASRYRADGGASFRTFTGRRAAGAMMDHVRKAAISNRNRCLCEPVEGAVGDDRLRPAAADQRSAVSREMVLRFARFLRGTWDRLPAQEREVIDLRYMQGLSVRETARALAVSLATVSRRERAGLDRLRAAFEATRFGRDCVVVDLAGSRNAP